MVQECTGVHSWVASGDTGPPALQPAFPVPLPSTGSTAISHTLAKEFSFLLSPAQSVLGDYSWPQMIFGFVVVVLYPSSLF